MGRHYRDVVRPAALVGEVDQPGAQIRKLRVVGNHVAEFLAADQPREPVRADDQRVAAAERLVGEIDLHARVGAKRLEDDVAALALLGFFLGQLASVHQPLHERLFLGELDRLAVAHKVGAAVADLREVEVVAVDPCRGDGGPHAAHLGVLARVGIDLLVGELDRFPHAVGEALGRGVVVRGPDGGEMAVDQVGGHGARQLAGGRAAHAVRHHEERPARSHLVEPDLGVKAGVPGAQVRDEESVLVVLPAPSQIGLAEDGNLDWPPRHTHPRKLAATAKVTRAVPSDDPIRRRESLTNLGRPRRSVNVRLS